MGIRSNTIVFSHPKKSQSLMSYITKYHKQFVITAITGIAFNTAIVFGPIFQGKLLDAAVSSKNIDILLKAGLEFIGVTLSFQVARFIKRYYVRDMANRMSGDMRVSIMESIFNTDLNTMEKQKVGDLMSTTIGDVDIVVEAVRKTITELWDTVVLMGAYFVTLMLYNPRITLIACIPIPIVIVLAQIMRKPVHSKAKAARKANSKTTTQIRKMISEINILRLYGREEAELKRLREKLDIQADATSLSLMLKNGLSPVYSSLATVGIIFVISLGGKEVISARWTIGTFTAYINIFIALSSRTTTAANVFNIQQGAKASWERIKKLITDTNQIVMVDEDSKKPKEIKIEKLSFKYPTSDKYAILNFSIRIPAGSIVGVTGPIGSGKSALGLALTGLYNYEGNIYLDNVELRDIPYDQKLATITYTGHDPFLFSDTIENNITWNDTNTEKLDKVLNIACLKQDISILEKGIKTEVGEKGTRVSGGQKQRISLARALYKNANLVILDDPFSAVDIRTESRIIDELRKKAQGRTIFIFSHRLAAFQYTDMVIVLDKGAIEEQGTHQQLINAGGIYSKIRSSQMFLGGEANAE